MHAVVNPSMWPRFSMLLLVTTGFFSMLACGVFPTFRKELAHHMEMSLYISTKFIFSWKLQFPHRPCLRVPLKAAGCGTGILIEDKVCLMHLEHLQVRFLGLGTKFCVLKIFEVSSLNISSGSYSCIAKPSHRTSLWDWMFLPVC